MVPSTVQLEKVDITRFVAIMWDGLQISPSSETSGNSHARRHGTLKIPDCQQWPKILCPSSKTRILVRSLNGSGHLGLVPECAERQGLSPCADHRVDTLLGSLVDSIERLLEPKLLHGVTVLKAFSGSLQCIRCSGGMDMAC